MAGPIQSAISGAISATAATTALAKKLHEDEKQVSEKASAEIKAQEEAQKAIDKEARESALEADLIRYGADPESAHSYVTAKNLGLDTKGFGMIRKKGKFVGSYSSLADKLSKDALTDSLSSKVISDKGFAARVVALSSNRKGRVEALTKASEGGEK